MTDDVGQDVADTGNHPTSDVAIDKYMQEQDEEDIGLAPMVNLDQGDTLAGEEQFKMVSNLAEMRSGWAPCMWYVVATR